MPRGIVSRRVGVRDSFIGIYKRYRLSVDGEYNTGYDCLRGRRGRSVYAEARSEKD